MQKPIPCQEPAERIDEHLLLQGWHAAERGEPMDPYQLEHWKIGHQLWCRHHPKTRLKIGALPA